MRRPIKVPEARRRAGSVQILALTGGGFRGLYTARVLERLEETLGENRRLSDAFDVIAGTSIGGIIAIGIALRVPAFEIRCAIETHGPTIFGVKKAKGVLSAKYAPGPLAAAIDAIIGDRPEKHLADLGVAVYIPAVNRTTGEAAPFEHIPAAHIKRKDSPALRDVAMATAAAPIYFPVHKVGDGEYVDGGVFANAPDLGALSFAIEKLSVKLDKVRILSIGTTFPPAGQSPLDDLDRGGADWLNLTSQEIVDLTFAAQQSHATKICRSLLGSRYLRLDREQHANHVPLLGLDKATKKSIQLLRQLADETVDDLTPGARNLFLAHTARRLRQK
jgi:hypothetical protein